LKRSAFGAAAAAWAVLPAPLPAHGGGAPRIASLAPSLTEMLFAIGAGPQVTGVSNFTTYPPAATKLPVVATFASVDAERIVHMHPALVAGISSQEPQVRDLRRAGLNVVLLRDDAFEDIFANLAVLGKLSGHAAEAAALSARLRAKTAGLVRGLKPVAHPPRVFVVLQVAPVFTVGDASFIAHLIRLAGGVNAAHNLDQAYGRFSEEALVALDPDLIVADRLSGITGVTSRAPWNALRAVREGRLYVLENADVLERPGPRYNEGLAWLIDILRPVRGR
jgi:iron complex transport system substrate-binding protein